MLLGLAKGKVGDLVFYRDGGEQRTRTRVIPKNPRTFSQMAQRVKIANVSGIYRAAAAILADSFSNRPSNQSGYNAFAKGAIANAPYLTKQQAAAGVVLPQPAMMSRGVLPALDYTDVTGEGVGGIGLALSLGDARPSSIGDVFAIMLQQYPNIQVGDEINFCTIKFTPLEGVESEVDLYGASFVSDSVVIDPADTTLIGDAAVNATTGLMYGKRASKVEPTDIFVSFIVHSRVDTDGRLSVSTQWSYLSPSAQALYDGYRTEEALNDAVESYKATATPILR